MASWKVALASRPQDYRSHDEKVHCALASPRTTTSYEAALHRGRRDGNPVGLAVDLNNRHLLNETIGHVVWPPHKKRNAGTGDGEQQKEDIRH
jgi:hypothetical protein